jgi:hypothetical protein
MTRAKQRQRRKGLYALELFTTGKTINLRGARCLCLLLFQADSERALLGRDRNLVFARQPLNCPVERGFLPFTAIFSSLRDCSLLVLSASQMAPAVLPISSSIVIPFPSNNPPRANTHHLRPIEAGEACSREPDPRPRKGRYILLLSILLRREMPLRISFTTSS